MDRRWKTADITDEMVCRAYLPQMEKRDREREAEKELSLGDILKRAFKRAQEPVAEEEFADAVLKRETGAPWKVIDSAIDRAGRRDLIEWGVTARSGWLTAKGKALVVAENGQREAADYQAHDLPGSSIKCSIPASMNLTKSVVSEK